MKIKFFLKMFLFVTSLFFVNKFALAINEPFLVKNINAKDPSIEINNVLYFSANSVGYGTELWRSDGTVEGTYLVKDINLGNNSSSPANLVSMGNILYFSANTPEYGTELWRSDGTVEGTYLVKNIYTGVPSSEPSNFLVIDNVLYFNAFGYGIGRELWRSDGTTEGTYLVKDIYPGYVGYHSDPSNLINVNNILYFSANSSGYGKELWRSDGTANGTYLVKDIYTGVTSSDLSNFINVNNILYFSATNSGYGKELWRSDGTIGGTNIVKDIYKGSGSSNPISFSSIDNVLYFSATDIIYGTELWRSDGTLNGTYVVRDMYPGISSSTPNLIFTSDNVLYFSATTYGYGGELWRSDGTKNGTYIVKDINTGANSSNISNFINVDNILYFSTNSYGYGKELWRSDGTDEGTYMIKDIYSGTSSSNPYNFSNLDNNLYFFATDTIFGTQFWKSNGTGAGTIMIKNINSGISNSKPTNFYNIGNILYFSANTLEYGTELWRSDGTDEGTYMVKDIYPGTSYGSPSNFIKIDNILYFFATNASFGKELWRSDGTEVGTYIVKDIYQGANSSIVTDTPHLIILDNILYFAADDYTHGEELWRSDGTEVGTYMVKDIDVDVHPTTGESLRFGGEPYNFFVSNGILYFSARDSTDYFNSKGFELWRSDGTESGTYMVKDIKSGGFASSYPGGSSPTINPKFLNIGNVLYFSATDATYGEELWRSDGTEAGTYIVKDIYPGGDSSISIPVKLDNVLYFCANDGTNSKELWRSDGTEAGTYMVKNIHSTSNSYCNNFIVFHDIVYFSARNSTAGRELWRTDGTEAGTYMVKDIYSGGESIPEKFIISNDTLYFSANSGYGQELWRTDGTTDGTYIVKDLYPGVTGSIPSNFIDVDGILYFSANNGASGIELWGLDTLLSSNNTLSSSDYIINNDLNTIRYVPSNTLVSTFKNKLIYEKGIKIDVFESNGITSKINTAKILSGDKIVSTAEDGFTKRIYTVDVLAEQQFFPNSSGGATINSDNLSLVLTDLSKEVDITTSIGVESPKIDLSSFIRSGMGILPQINIIAENVHNISVAIPKDTVVMNSNELWDGIISTPVSSTITTEQSENKKVDTVIEVGVPNIKLSFDKAIKLTFPDKADKKAGYISTDGEFVEIKDICSVNSELVSDTIPIDGECKIIVGDDLIIWTKHFTKFATFDFNIATLPNRVICRNVTFSDWGNCINGIQNRTVLTFEPATCIFDATINSQLFRACDINNIKNNLTEESNEPNISYGNENVDKNIIDDAPPFLDEKDVRPKEIQKQDQTKKILYKNGVLLRAPDYKIYVVSGNKLLHVKTIDEFKKKYSNKKILEVSYDIIYSYNNVSNSASEVQKGLKKYSDGSLLRGDNAKIYVLIDGKKQHIKTIEELKSKYKNKTIYNVSDEILSQY